MRRVAIIGSHPIQYYAPWFRNLSANASVDFRVFYLWDFGVANRHDPGFGKRFSWDVDLLTGYAHEFVPNISWRPGTSHFLGLINPGLKRALARFRPDALVVFGYSQASLLWLCLTAREPFLLRGDSHALESPPSVGGLRGKLRHRVLHRAAGHLAVGRANAQWITQHGVPSERIFHAPHAIDQARFQSAVDRAPDQRSRIRRELGIADDQILFGFVGKLEDNKQPLLLLEAFRQTQSNQSDLLIVGSGALEEQVTAATAANPRIHRFPFLNQSEIPFIHDAIDVLVLPSAHETWGLVVNEAQALGKPVIVSDHVGCHPDLVIPGETGWVFPAGDVSGLSRVLQDAASDRERLARMGRSARILSARYSFDVATDGLMTALGRIVPP